jgi:hypothetical protein
MDNGAGGDVLLNTATRTANASPSMSYSYIQHTFLGNALNEKKNHVIKRNHTFQI